MIGDMCKSSSREMGNLSIIGSNIMVTLRLGATRKHTYQISLGDSAIVKGHVDYWNHNATVIHVDKKRRHAYIQWDNWDRKISTIPISKIAD